MLRMMVATTLMVLAMTAASQAGPISVGSGDNHATVVVNWSSGQIREFDVAFASQSILGLEAFDIIEAETTLTTDRKNFGFGVFIDGITMSGSSDIGFGGGDNWWHYWTMNAEETEWYPPMFGANTRVLYDGDSDGWVYGNADAPQVPEPATMLLLLTGGAALLRRARRA